MIVIYGRWKFGQATYKCCQLLNIDSVMMDDTDRDDDILTSAEAIIITPGISPQHDIYQTYWTKITGDLDYRYHILQNNKRLQNISFIAVTGTDGKSSTCWILSQLLEQLSHDWSIGKVWLAGNFDRPLWDVLHEIISTDQTDQKHIIVLEISSFMAHNIHQMIFDYSIFTNFKKDHLNRHTDMQDYFDAKYHIVEQTKLLSVINPDIIKSEYIPDPNTLNCNISPINHNLHYTSQFTGCHNMQNIDAAYQIAKDIVNRIDPWFDNNIILEYIAEISTLYHRIELIWRTSDGISIYDDGKSTTAQSLRAAITSFSRVVLIAWWSDKWDDFTVLQSDFVTHVGAWVFLGQTKNQFAQLCDVSEIPYHLVDSMQDAVTQSIELARQYHIDTIIFSPWCASFDMFINREDRVQQFLHHIHPYLTWTTSS